MLLYMIECPDVLNFSRNVLCFNPESKSTTMGQAEACAAVMQRAWVRSPVGTSFLGEVFSGFFLTCKTNVGKL